MARADSRHVPAGVYEIDFDVSDAVGTGEILRQRAWLRLPATSAPSLLFVCFAGVSYDKHYWNTTVSGFQDYSFSDYMAERGFAVLAVDHLGTGDSSYPTESGPVSIDMLARGNADVVRQTRMRAEAGSLHADLAPCAVPVIGIGHSFGAGVALLAQSYDEQRRLFDALVLQGFAMHDYENVPESIDHRNEAGGQTQGDAIDRNESLLRELTESSDDALSCVIPRDHLRELFYAADVPDSVIAASGVHATQAPIRAVAEMMTAGAVEVSATRAEVPILLVYGGLRDLAPDPSAEVPKYPRSPVTLCVVSGSAHIHNLASARTELWDRIASWAKLIVQ